MIDQAQIQQRAGKLKLILLDVDGVLSDGRIIYDSAGRESKAFCVRDGAGIKYLQRVGLEVGIMTGRDSEPVNIRARELGIELVIQGAKRKLDAFEKMLECVDYTPEQIAFMGDDLLDLPVLRRVGLALAPADAVDEVLQVVHHVTRAKGGYGAVREAAELIIKAQGKWDKIMERYIV